mmetsp:Transcript_35189/g.57521  ORF Transcript_35189/g.57521 Transcript_35189/m.57521 type:complete len:645 (+) Transcript_35189:53-1987(+)
MTLSGSGTRLVLIVVASVTLTNVCAQHQDDSNVVGWSNNYGNTDSEADLYVTLEASSGAFITKVCGRWGGELDAVQAYFSDGTVSELYGDTDAGTYGCLSAVSSGHCITAVDLHMHKCGTCSKWRVQTLQFTATNGAILGTMGSVQGDQYTVQGESNQCLTKMQLRFEDVGFFSSGYYRLIGTRFYFAATPSPTKAPTPKPTPMPTKNPTKAPTPVPSSNPSLSPSQAPTLSPTLAPTPQCPTVFVTVHDDTNALDAANFDGLYTYVDSSQFARPRWHVPQASADKSIHYTGSSWVINGEGDDFMSIDADSLYPPDDATSWTHSTASATFHVTITCIGSYSPTSAPTFTPTFSPTKPPTREAEYVTPPTLPPTDDEDDDNQGNGDDNNTEQQNASLFQSNPAMLWSIIIVLLMVLLFSVCVCVFLLKRRKMRERRSRDQQQEGDLMIELGESANRTPRASAYARVEGEPGIERGNTAGTSLQPGATATPGRGTPGRMDFKMPSVVPDLPGTLPAADGDMEFAEDDDDEDEQDPLNDEAEPENVRAPSKVDRAIDALINQDDDVKPANIVVNAQVDSSDSSDHENEKMYSDQPLDRKATPIANRNPSQQTVGHDEDDDSSAEDMYDAMQPPNSTPVAGNQTPSQN